MRGHRQALMSVATGPEMFVTGSQDNTAALLGRRLGNGTCRPRLWFSEIRISLIQWVLSTSRQFGPTAVLTALLASALSVFRTRAALQLEILALRHQLGVLQRSVKKPKLTGFDRMLWAWFCGTWAEWRSALCIVKPETVITWHRKGFRLFWSWKVRRGQPGRPPVSKEIRKLIRKMSRENPLWGAPRIHGELLKLGIDVGETSVSKYMVRRRNPPSQTWRTFLENHLKTTVSIDFFTVPTFGSRYSSCSWSWHTTEDGSCISMSPLIRRPSGPRSNFARHSRLSEFPSICYAIAIGSSVRTSQSRSSI
jgi:hypothetical protein